MNTCNIGGGQPTVNYANVSAAVSGFHTWEIVAISYSGPQVNLLFGSAPTTGVYHTVDYSSPEEGDVYVSFFVGSINDHLEGGSNVYVNRISAGVFDISICDAPWILNSANPIYFNTRLRSPL